MIADGFYKVTFSALLQGVGGIVVFEGGRIRGGDDQYLYSGTVTGPDERLLVDLTVKAYAPGAISVFGSQGGKFTLQLVGNVVGRDLQFSGPSPIPGSPGITVHAAFVSDLALY
ncbi:GrlR family regulatory protein [Paraburkholderia kururiensis]|uniref:GrlR family regulatory protein n=1 Tax=Paraburkholderia kururiensis TaxID=984307 RepID=UPI0005AB4956|nr:GrlR family regulatory protein [Paraburkholderia kururiensis]